MNNEQIIICPFIKFGDEKFELDFLENIELKHWVPKGTVKREIGLVISHDFKRENGKWSTAVKDVVKKSTRKDVKPNENQSSRVERNVG